MVWIIVVFYQLFGLSFWRHPFTAEDPLVSNISLNLFWWRNKLIYIVDEQILILSELFFQCDALHLCKLRRTDFIHSLNHQNTSWLKDTEKNDDEKHGKKLFADGSHTFLNGLTVKTLLQAIV